MSDEQQDFQLPDNGYVLWPVGTGDSTTICVDSDTVVQVDLRHLSKAEDEDDPHVSIIDELGALLPTVDHEPHLALFVLTHPDEDHCLGFADLLERVTIGELWFSPRIFREYSKDLCDDAKAFRKEAKRRVKGTIDQNGDVASGDRVRIIGYDDLLEEDEYKGFPRDLLTVPGNGITEFDGKKRAGIFRAFVHAPFKDDSAGDRNDTSISLQVTLTKDKISGRLLLLGDLAYPTIRNIFDRSEDDDLAWNILLAPHHCSKSVMYWKDEDEEEESLKQDILDDFAEAAGDPGYIVASSEPVHSSNKPGDNPPHAKAKSRYEEIAPSGFWCTQEYQTEENPEPMVFELTSDGIDFQKPEKDEDARNAKTETAAAAGIEAARGASEPPQDRVGFGSHD